MLAQDTPLLNSRRLCISANFLILFIDVIDVANYELAPRDSAHHALQRLAVHVCPNLIQELLPLSCACLFSRVMSLNGFKCQNIKTIVHRTLGIK